MQRNWAYPTGPKGHLHGHALERDDSVRSVRGHALGDDGLIVIQTRDVVARLRWLEESWFTGNSLGKLDNTGSYCRGSALNDAERQGRRRCSPVGLVLRWPARTSQLPTTRGRGGGGGRGVTSFPEERHGGSRSVITEAMKAAVMAT
jgi:hypothetical protein